jgi:hypothetical protein
MRQICFRIVLLLGIFFTSADPVWAADFTCVGHEIIGNEIRRQNSSNGAYRRTITLEQGERIIARNIATKEGERRRIDVSHIERIDGSFYRRVGNSRCVELLISGQIVPGDAEKLIRIISNPNMIRILYLNSPGGDVNEAMKIGDLVRSLFMVTQAPQWLDFDQSMNILARPNLRISYSRREENLCRGDNCICASACVLIWAAGVERRGDVLGLHRPSFNEQAFGPISAAQAQQLYQRAVRDITSYLQRMELPALAIQTFLDTDSRQLVIPPRDRRGTEYGAWGGGHAASIAEWIRVYCPLQGVAQNRDDAVAMILEDRRNPRRAEIEIECVDKLLLSERSQRYARRWGF